MDYDQEVKNARDAEAEPLLLNKYQIAKVLNVGYRTIERWSAARKIPRIWINRRVVLYNPLKVVASLERRYEKKALS
jgi:hypothetical protein